MRTGAWAITLSALAVLLVPRSARGQESFDKFIIITGEIQGGGCPSGWSSGTTADTFTDGTLDFANCDSDGVYCIPGTYCYAFFSTVGLMCPRGMFIKTGEFVTNGAPPTGFDASTTYAVCSAPDLPSPWNVFESCCAYREPTACGADMYCMAPDNARIQTPGVPAREYQGGPICHEPWRGGCSGHGDCVVETDGYLRSYQNQTCHCAPGYSGALCETADGDGGGGGGGGGGEEEQTCTYGQRAYGPCLFFKGRTAPYRAWAKYPDSSSDGCGTVTGSQPCTTQIAGAPTAPLGHDSALTVPPSVPAPHPDINRAFFFETPEEADAYWEEYLDQIEEEDEKNAMGHLHAPPGDAPQHPHPHPHTHAPAWGPFSNAVAIFFCLLFAVLGAAICFCGNAPYASAGRGVRRSSVHGE